MPDYFHIVTGEEREAIQRAARAANAAAPIAANATMPLEQLGQSIEQSWREKGINPADRPLLQELLKMRYPDDFLAALREHNIPVK